MEMEAYLLIEPDQCLTLKHYRKIHIQCVCAKERKVQVTRLCCHLSLKPSPGTELYLYKNIKIFTGVRETATQRVIERKRRRQSGDEEILLLCLSLPKADNWRPHLDSRSKRRAEKERRRSDRGQRGERQRENREREATSTCMTHSLSLLLLCNSSSMSLSHSHCQRGQTELRAAVFPKYSTIGTIYVTWVTVPVSATWVVVAVNHHWCQ